MATNNLLHRAAAQNDADTARHLLDSQHLSPDAQNPIGQAPLHLAAMWGHLEIANLLLERGAKVDIQNDYGITPLHYAAEKSKRDLAQLLVSYGADTQLVARNGLRAWEMVDEDDEELRTLCGKPDLKLHAALHTGDAKNIKALFESGAGGLAFDDCDLDGRTVFHLAVATSGPPPYPLLDALLEAAAAEPTCLAGVARALKRRDIDGLNPFHVAARTGSAALLEHLLDTVPPPAARTMLQTRTVQTGELYTGQWGKKAADGEIEPLDRLHMTMLHLAIERVMPEDDDADDDDANDGKMAATPEAIAEAASKVRLLAGRGADPNALDGLGRTPMHMAAMCGAPDLVKLLLDAGGDPTVGGKSIGRDNTLLHHATQCGDQTMAKLLLEAAAAAKKDAPWSPSAKLDVDAPGQSGFTALGFATRANNVELAKILLDAGAQPGREMGNGKTALQIAQINKRAKLIELFSAHA